MGSLFSADAWNNITFTAGEVKNPQRNVPLLARVGHVDRDRPVYSRQRRLRCRAALGTSAARAVRPRGGRHASSHFPHRGSRSHGGRHHDLRLRLHQRHAHVRRPSLLRHGARRLVLQARRNGESRARSRSVARHARRVGRVSGSAPYATILPLAHMATLQQSARLRGLCRPAVLYSHHRGRLPPPRLRPTSNGPIAPGAILWYPRFIS